MEPDVRERAVVVERRRREGGRERRPRPGVGMQGEGDGGVHWRERGEERSELVGGLQAGFVLFGGLHGDDEV